MTLSRQALVVRVAAFLALTWLLLAVLGATQQLLPGIPAGLALPQLAPGLAALVMIGVWRGDAVRLSFALGTRAAWRVCLAVAVPLSITGIAAAAASIVPEWRASALALAWIPLGALGEELGWRGYLNRILASRWRGLSSAVFVGVVWLPFHVGLWGIGALRLSLFGVTLVAASTVIFAIVGDAGFSVSLATLFHIAMNVSAALLGDAAVSLPVLAVSAGVWALAAIVAVLVRRRIFLSPAPSNP